MNDTENNIETIADEVHANAVNKGFHPQEEPLFTWFSNQVNNSHCELSELWESYRSGNFSNPCDKNPGLAKLGLQGLTCAEEEYADILIRTLDQMRRLKIEIGRVVRIKHAYNLTRPHKHGKIN